VLMVVVEVETVVVLVLVDVVVGSAGVVVDVELEVEDEGLEVVLEIGEAEAIGQIRLVPRYTIASVFGLGVSTKLVSYIKHTPALKTQAVELGRKSAQARTQA